jgi:ribonuclease BN (tRNA processing enzyme)
MGIKQSERDFPRLTREAAGVIASVLERDRRVLLFGAPGVGKSTLVTRLAKRLAQAQRNCWCISADPGSPLMGVPGAVTLGHWQQDAWQVDDYAALCTLDAGRFRLPLVSAVRRLLKQSFDGVMLVDGPGVARGVAGSELLEGLAEATRAHVVLVITPTGKTPPLVDELRTLKQEVYLISAAEAAMRPGKRVRARVRTAQWDGYLHTGITQSIDLDSVHVIGTPPPREEASVWTGRQIALIQAQHTLAMGEVQQLEGNQLTVTLPERVSGADTLLIRDAARTADGVIETAAPWTTERLHYLPPVDVLPSITVNNGPRLVGRVGSVKVALINGVFGDPLLHVRLQNQRRSLLFDLGSGERLSSRLAHQVTDVFITHAHLDHISGFISLLRSRIGEFPPCRLYGPTGLARHIAGFIQGVLWDRVAGDGPRFQVMEFDGKKMRCFHLEATRPEPQLHYELAVEQGLIYEDAGFRIRGVILDHQGTEVVAYAFEPDRQINVRKDRLVARGLEPGPWLKELKQQLLCGNETATICLPDGSDASVAALATELLLISPGKKLVYATDLADTADNRQRLIGLAQHAHTFFCEAPFVEAEAEHALRNGHLTTVACAEIAMQAGVARLIPFHFSRRYIADPQQIYDELKTICPRVVIPQSMRLFDAASATLTETQIELN